MEATLIMQATTVPDMVASDAVEDHTAHNNAEIYHSIIEGVCRRTAEVDDRTSKKHKYNA